MKMPSTYISLLLLCGFMYVFYIAHYNTRRTAAPAITRPAVKATRPVVKRLLPHQFPAVPLDKSYNHEKDPRQALLNKTGFSFFRDVICSLAPVLKNIK